MPEMLKIKFGSIITCRFTNIIVDAKTKKQVRDEHHD